MKMNLAVCKLFNN